MSPITEPDLTRYDWMPKGEKQAPPRCAFRVPARQRAFAEETTCRLCAESHGAGDLVEAGRAGRQVALPSGRQDLAHLIV